MPIFVLISIAFRSLLGNKLRSFLAVLGIIIGVGAVIAMLSIGAGARASMIQQLESLGTNLLIVRPALKNGPGGVRSIAHRSLTAADGHAILKEVPGIYAVAPVVTGRSQVKYYDQNANVNLVGTANTYFEARNYEVERGRQFTDGEVDNLSRVAIIGPATAENLIGVDDPLTATIKVDGISFRVIGVTAAKGDQGWYNPDDLVIVPYTTAIQVLLGTDYLNEIDVQGEPGYDLNVIQGSIQELLRRRHKLEPEAENDFGMSNQTELLKFLSSITTTLSVLLASIGSISLLVGGIGIMNIMLVTVTERTREIGIRKAIGAREQDILRQFLFEAIVMSTIGGIMGVLLGVGVSNLLPLFTEIYPVVQTENIVMSITSAAIIGIFFGYYPAQRAARLNPIDALRYE
jgi:putative ABC transport system permease protein